MKECERDEERSKSREAERAWRGVRGSRGGAVECAGLTERGKAAFREFMVEVLKGAGRGRAREGEGNAARRLSLQISHGRVLEEDSIRRC
jgi:hypothetical protein